MKPVAWALALAALVPQPASACTTLELPDAIAQGELVIGCAPAGEVKVDGRSVRVAGDGRFVFGVARDATQVAIRWRATDGGPSLTVLDVQPREWRIERVDGLPPQTVTPDPDIAARIAREQAAVATARERDDARTDFANGFLRPVDGGRVSGVYGSQRILNGEPRSPHYGLDIAVPTGTPVVAPADGVITLAEPDLYLTGGTLLIDHGHGVTSSFLHLSQLDVAVGDTVERGQRIAAVGATGRASGPHLHWGVNWFDVRVDPALLLSPP